jgi:hypothetical protein
MVVSQMAVNQGDTWATVRKGSKRPKRRKGKK